jgi:hypothetical protein
MECSLVLVLYIYIYIYIYIRISNLVLPMLVYLDVVSLALAWSKYCINVRYVSC